MAVLAATPTQQQNETAFSRSAAVKKELAAAALEARLQPRQRSETGEMGCRWNYRDEEDVYNVDTKFDEHDIPYDVLWLDIEHTDGKKYFTWDRVLFPNPEEMQKKLAAKGRHMVTIVDPHIKRDESHFIHKEASEKGYYVKDATGKDYDGWCWPGSLSYLDTVNPEIRSWWAEKFSYKNYVGSTPSLYYGMT
ncbi:hypothetical protein DH2020_015725 [Rehmannia glutinosa]|uniref:Glycoside hydrolase family 31 TIM barrel domain-containing protein n=1 Tax=Rehmannia glutinosa TaxID=99300 RepID=A0ABR0WTG0_REHGL